MVSPLNWSGGKRWQVPAVLNLLGPRLHGELQGGARRWVEPFCGGCSMAFGVLPQKALLNDINPDLVNFWQVLQSDYLFDVNEYDPSLYYGYRDLFNVCMVPEEKAELFYVLNQWCFNGLWRTNQSGEFNVPQRPVLRPLKEIPLETRKQTWNWHFTCEDYQTMLFEHDDVIYADPPYDEGHTYSEQFHWNEQQRIAVVLSLHAGPVVLTNKATPAIQKLYTDLGYQLTIIDGQQRFHHSQGQREPVLEVIATRNLLTQVIR